MGFLVSALSPFCVNSATSKILMEICYAGGLKTVEVDIPRETSGKEKLPAAKKECPYCFAAQMAKFVPVSFAFNISFPLGYSSYLPYRDDTPLSSVRSQKREARAPPTLT